MASAFVGIPIILGVSSQLFEYLLSVLVQWKKKTQLLEVILGVFVFSLKLVPSGIVRPMKKNPIN